jgi:hypothetical protein
MTMDLVPVSVTIGGACVTAKSSDWHNSQATSSVSLKASTPKASDSSIPCSSAFSVVKSKGFSAVLPMPVSLRRRVIGVLAFEPTGRH